jgi:nuclear transcription Y subunit beta
VTLRAPRACCRASDKCQREKRKTINGDDLLWAMNTLGFEDYIEPLQVYLQKFRDAEVGGACSIPLRWRRAPAAPPARPGRRAAPLLAASTGCPASQPAARCSQAHMAKQSATEIKE